MELENLSTADTIPTLKALCINCYLQRKHNKTISEHEIEGLPIAADIKNLLRAYKSFEQNTIYAQLEVFITLNDFKKRDAALHYLVRKKITTKDHVKKLARDFFRDPPDKLEIALKYYSEVPIPIQDWEPYREYIEDEKQNYIRQRQKISTQACACCVVFGICTSAVLSAALVFGVSWNS